MTNGDPNILFIFSDQHRHDVLGCAGHPVVETPHLDRLAAEGVRFTETWCQSPICQPSRASVITGQYTHQFNMFSNTGPLDRAQPTVMRALQARGYETATIGKTHYHGMPTAEQVEESDGSFDMRGFAPFVQDFGWDYVLEEYDRYVHVNRKVRTPYTDHLADHGVLDPYRDMIKSVFRLTPDHWRARTSVLPQELDLSYFLADRAIDWLEGRTSDKPFLLMLGFVQPHVPLIDDPVWAEYYRDADIELPDQTVIDAPNAVWGEHIDYLKGHSQVQVMDDALVREGIRHYLGMVSLIDQRIGDVIRVLEDSGEIENTWIIYSCDHGEMLGEHHLWAKQNFYRGSAKVPLIIRPPGGTAGHLDAGLTELTDVTATLADIGGASLPTCRGQSLLPRVAGSVRSGREHVFSRIRSYAALRGERYRLTVDVESDTPCELFDLVDDPGELRNLVNEPGHGGQIKELKNTVLAEHLTG
ncbi:MAG: sulfatase-like hydrolase/transferase [Chloroflexi bacterium]|nr:sulfatase-like hydrolase/transferase [Chloroflexota bacterium]